MKKILIFSGLSIFAASAYWYFKKQLDLALEYDYDVSGIRITKLTESQGAVEADIKLVNKSVFEIEVTQYDLEIYYKDVAVARSYSIENFIIKPDSFSSVRIAGEVSFAAVKDVIFPFFLNVIKQKPVNIAVSGYVKVRFMGIPHTIKFAKEQYEYSSDMLAEYGLLDDWEKLKEKIPFLKKIK